MIDDPSPWRDELVAVGERLEAKTKQKRWTARTDYLIERDFASGAYAMRKLIESHHVPDGLATRRVPVRSFERRGKRSDAIRSDHIETQFDLENGRRRTLSVVELCHEIGHSIVFTIYCGETADLFDGVYVSSNRDKTRYLYLLLASDYIALCDDIGTDRTASM